MNSLNCSLTGMNRAHTDRAAQTPELGEYVTVNKSVIQLGLRNYRNSEMTTRDVQLGNVHVLGLGIIGFYSDSQQNEPA